MKTLKRFEYLFALKFKGIRVSFVALFYVTAPSLSLISMTFLSYHSNFNRPKNLSKQHLIAAGICTTHLQKRLVSAVVIRLWNIVLQFRRRCFQSLAHIEHGQGNCFGPPQLQWSLICQSFVSEL